MTRRSPALARTVVVGGVAVAVVLAGVAPATAVDIVEGDRPVVVVEDQSEFAATAELADTGPNDEFLLTMGIIAGALLVGGIVVSALGASRRRSRRD
jgi:hypothetical protein